MMSWKEKLDELPSEQRFLIEGGSLSQRFSKMPLSSTHPALLGGFYGILISLALLLPLGAGFDWKGGWLRDWAWIAIWIILLNAIIGHVSLIVAGILRRPPISLPRKLVYPMPFIGLILFTVILITDVENNIPDSIEKPIYYTSLMLLLVPGQIYVHLSWAPRWRLLCRLEDNLDPFDGAVTIATEGGEDEADPDFTSAIESIEEEPPVLYESEE